MVLEIALNDLVARRDQGPVYPIVILFQRRVIGGRIRGRSARAEARYRVISARICYESIGGANRQGGGLVPGEWMAPKTYYHKSLPGVPGAAHTTSPASESPFTAWQRGSLV